MGDYVSCKYCGITERGHKCPYRKSRQKSGDKESDKFRNTRRWQRKRDEIKTRDRCLCQLCIRNLYNTLDMLNFKNIEVHHITPVNEDYNRRLDNDNLISLCSYHHKMAEKGQIPKEELYKIVEEICND